VPHVSRHSLDRKNERKESVEESLDAYHRWLIEQGLLEAKNGEGIEHAEVVAMFARIKLERIQG
jgi:heat shock protein HspQ